MNKILINDKSANICQISSQSASLFLFSVQHILSLRYPLLSLSMHIQPVVSAKINNREETFDLFLLLRCLICLSVYDICTYQCQCTGEYFHAHFLLTSSKGIRIVFLTTIFLLLKLHKTYTNSFLSVSHNKLGIKSIR